MRIEIYPTYAGRTKRQRKPHLIGPNAYGPVTCSWDWRAIATNGDIVASSHQGYERSSDAVEAVRRFKRKLNVAAIRILK